ncbi:TonB-dependent receptor [Dyella monticola]|uniref:TonB-dependent receptor n=1 Tax=Dyella monticola TaxID=1927958 RepID=A0A370WSG9_9GAMM|nr:TonB-dependent receptor [Dyella monticola]RDS79064.1 TonB-dependent receptor [Dyella monticola]
MSIRKFVSAPNGIPVRHTALAVAVAVGFGFSSQVFAQATTGTIFGQAPVASGETVQVVGGSGFNRTVPVDKSGRYSLTLPVGVYTVTLIQNGQNVQTKQNVTALAAKSVAVDFVAAAGATSTNAQNLSSVMVTANAIPPIDVTSTQESTVITAEQLKNLPLARTGAAIALLAPGTVQGATALGNGPTGEPLLSFGGSSVVENAYYINGFNTTDPLSDSGGITLPYGAIAQQETLTNGYGPEYGRSTGGVISQVGASGTNTWHFGGAMFFTPSGLQGNQGNLYYANPAITPSVAAANNLGNVTPGTLLDYRNGNSQWEQVYDAYVGGPLIKDRLFFFLAAEADHKEQDNVDVVSSPYEYQNSYSDPKYYAKLDWNITDSNTLSLTSIKNTESYSGPYYNYDYDTKTEGDLAGYQQSFKNSFSINVLKFTSYITDDLTLNAMIGKLDGTYYTNTPGAAGNADLPNIANPSFQSVNGATPNGGAGYSNAQVNALASNPAHKSSEVNFRFDLTYKLGDHTLQAGLDNQTTTDKEDGSLPTGPGYQWVYENTAKAGTPIAGSTPGVAPYVAPIAGADYVTKTVFITSTSVAVKQYAQYIKDTWQVTPNLLLNLGLRNDQFTNYNPDGEPYVNLHKPQWAPRLGFSWDIMGDSTMKLFGNAGRYYMALPTGVALREASASTFTSQYYTYTGVTPTGIPTGLTPIYSCGQTCGAGVPVSVNNEYGEPLDPSTVAAANLKASYQDSFVLGFQHQFAPNWDYGVTATWTKLESLIDDTGEGPLAICTALLAQNPGLLNAAPNAGADCGPSMYVNASILINPGATEQYKIKNLNGGYSYATVSPSMLGFPAAFRHYYSLESFIEHTWDGKWTAKLDYVYSKSYGTSEGPVQSNIGQGGSSQSATEQWDYTAIMSYANGLEANNRKHVLKGYGTYAFTPEWSLSAVLTLASGTPVSCLGLYGPDQSNPGLAYGPGNYHWCGGVPTPTGSTGFTPWIHTLDLALQYRPEWAAKKLAFQVQVRNITNEQKITQYVSDYGSTTGPSPLYKSGVVEPAAFAAVEQPRTVQFGITYDW